MVNLQEDVTSLNSFSGFLSTLTIHRYFQIVCPIEDQILKKIGLQIRLGSEKYFFFIHGEVGILGKSILTNDKVLN